MEPHIGSEQGGTRPVVVLQNDVGNRYAPTLIVATVTSRIAKKADQPTHVLIDQNPAFSTPSMVQAEQIFTIDKSRVQRFLGRITPSEMYRIEAAVINSLDLNGGRECSITKFHTLIPLLFLPISSVRMQPH